MLNNSQQAPYMLNERHFFITLLVAMLLHSLGFIVWNLSPKSIVQDIPIRVLNIRLGAGDEQDPELEKIETQAALNTNAPSVDDALDRIAKDMQKKQPEPEASGNQTQAAPQVKAPDKLDAKQFVREVNSVSKNAALTSPTGTKDAEIMSRYTQLISLWIQKFKVYPEEARVQGLKGSTVVRVRIDRKGTVRYYALEYTTGSEMLDHAAIDMIKRANPVPAVPSDYPKGELLEFLIPVSFSLL